MTNPKPKEWIKGIATYVPGKSAAADGRKLIKLSANENPLGCSPNAAAEFEKAGAGAPRYPDPAATKLREALAAQHDLDPARIIYGTGSDDLLNLVANAYSGPGDEVLYMQYGFAVYDIAARRYGGTPVIAPAKDYGTDVDALLACVKERTKLIYVANPNNPTGTLASRADIARLHAALPEDVLLVLDQAYAEYLTPEQDDGGLDLARTASNVLVTRTFSKIYGLAAERIGWGYASQDIIDTLHKIRAPFNVTSAGQAAAIAATADTEFVDQSRAHNAKWLSWLAEELGQLGNYGVGVVPSYCNFLLLTFDGAVTAAEANAGLMDAGYIVRASPGPGMGNMLRITIGTEEETKGIAAALRNILVQDD